MKNTLLKFVNAIRTIQCMPPTTEGERLKKQGIEAWFKEISDLKLGTETNSGVVAYLASTAYEEIVHHSFMYTNIPENIHVLVWVLFRGEVVQEMKIITNLSE